MTFIYSQNARKWTNNTLSKKTLFVSPGEAKVLVTWKKHQGDFSPHPAHYTLSPRPSDSCLPSQTINVDLERLGWGSVPSPSLHRDKWFFHGISSKRTSQRKNDIVNCMIRGNVNSRWSNKNKLVFKVMFRIFCFVCFYVLFSRQGFSVALEPVLELAFVDQAGLEPTEIHLFLPPECWAPPLPGFMFRMF